MDPTRSAHFHIFFGNVAKKKF
ncbi:MAG: hypothetical protein ACLR0I_07160 [Streptococcus salivarius]